MQQLQRWFQRKYQLRMILFYQFSFLGLDADFAFHKEMS